MVVFTIFGSMWHRGLLLHGGWIQQQRDLVQGAAQAFAGKILFKFIQASQQHRPLQACKVNRAI
jgi:hypothetical protein